MKRDMLLAAIIGILSAIALGFSGVGLVAVAAAISSFAFYIVVGTDPALGEEEDA